MKDQQSKVKPLPLLIGPANAEAVTGFSWRWCRDAAAALGVPFVVHGRKRALRAEAFIAALEREAELPTNGEAQPPAPADPAAAVRASLGLRLKAGGQ